MLMCHRRRDERGAVLILTAILLVVLLGIAAFAVDLGYAYEQRRQVQNSADAAALGAAQDLPNLTTTEADAKSISLTNLPKGAFPWTSCTDSGSLGVNAADTSCISYDTSFTQVRVHLPQQTMPTFFGRVLGVSSTSTSASATARLVSAGFASIVPYALFAGFNGGLACLKQGPSGLQIPTCDAPTTGNFNLLDIVQYGNTTLNTPQRCGTDLQAQRMVDNIAMGTDHLFTVYNGTELLDACGQPGPNAIPPRTGNFISAFDTGLVHAVSTNTSDGGGARLTRGRYPKASALGMQLDNQPLWEFIPEGTQLGVPASCQDDIFDDLLVTTPQAQQQSAMQGALQRCFNDYQAGGYTAPVFTARTHPFGKTLGSVDPYDVQLSPRFSYVPQFLQSTPPGGTSSNLDIGSFRTMFIQDVYARCTSGSGCNVDFAPGPWNTGSLGALNDSTGAMSAWVFPASMLPAPLQGSPAAVGQKAYIQLVK